LNRLVKAALAAAAIFGAARLLRKLRQLADPDASLYGHPTISRTPGP
jgi:hypothetical protein